MQYTQKRGRVRTSFHFGESELTYTFGEAGRKAGGSVAYHKIPGRVNTREVRSWWLKYVAVAYVVFCAMVGFCAKDENNLDMLLTALYGATLAFSCICLFAFSRRQGSMTTLPLNPALVILQDDKYQVIYAEVMKRRAVAMKTKLAQVDFNRPYYEEASKFAWLKEEGIITGDEYRQARQKIDAMRSKAAFTPPGSGNVN